MSHSHVIACSLRRLRSALRRGPALHHATSPEIFGPRMAACRAGLHAFGAASDEEFTALAKGLSQLNTRLTALRTDTDSLDAVLQDRDEERAVSSAYALYKNSIDLVHANAGITVSAQTQLREVETALMDACRGKDVFQRDHLFLGIVTMSIRIEASRLPAEAQTVFLNVAAAIAETGGQIRQCTETAFARIEAIIGESIHARAALHASEQVLHLQARQSLDTLQRELDALKSALAPCAEHSRSLAELFRATQPQTLAVISALQHQDIVRQQLEHAAEGFQDLDDHLHPDAPAIEWGYVDHAVRIQTAQLAASRQEIAQAGTTVVTGLGALLETSATMVEHFTEMESAAVTAFDHCQIAALFSAEIGKLASLVDQSQQANARTTLLVDRIDEIVRSFSEEIGRYELDVKIVALNAQIAAARLASADALNRLAEETRRVSEANARVTRALSDDLQASLAKLQDVRSGGAEFVSIITREKTELENGLGQVTAKLANLVQRVRTGAAEARQGFAPVHSECRALLDALRFPELIESTFAPAEQLCLDLAAASAGSERGGHLTVSAVEKITKHRQRYTMSKEDATHAAALTGIAVAAVADNDSIELFDEPAPPVTEALIPATPAALPEDSASDAPKPVAAGERVADVAAACALPSTPASPAADKSFGDGIELF